MKISFPLVALAFLSGCAAPTPPETVSAKAAPQSLVEARRGFKTSLRAQTGEKTAVEMAPPKIFRTIKYPSAVGNLAAYVSPAPKAGKKHPAIVWITGGDCNSIGDVWSSAPFDNDQTAAAYRQAGIVMMFPSLRGGNDNPGRKEGFLGEVDDVVAAAKWLEKQPYVDPKRIYLGGHSTGGTLALLVAQSTSRFRGVFSFGPVEDVSGYGDDSGFLPFDTKNEREIQLRSPGFWLPSVQSPLWILEGTADGNLDSLRAMETVSANPQVQFVAVDGANHFSILAPTNRLIARKILADQGAKTNISLSPAEVTQNFKKLQP